ncbi:MAG: hypothetical protein ABIW49_11160 [Knoellia sp.]
MDESLTMFSQSEADDFRALVRTRLAEMGFEVEVEPDCVRTDDGRVWGLWNLAANCHNSEDGRASWGETISTHFGTLFAANEEKSPLDLGLEATLESIHARLVDASQLQQLGAGWFGYATEFAPDVVRLLVLDTPTTVHTPAEDKLTEVAPLATLLDRGWRNTRALLDSEAFEVEHLEHDGHAFTCVFGDSVFTASMALFLPEAVARWQPGADLSEGIIFSIPHRNQLSFATAQPAQSALGALMLMPRFAHRGYSDSAGAISPHTYYWRDGVVTQLTQFTDEGANLTPGPDLERILEALQ